MTTQMDHVCVCVCVFVAVCVCVCVSVLCMMVEVKHILRWSQLSKQKDYNVFGGTKAVDGTVL